MGKQDAWSGGVFVGLFGLLATFAGCSGSVQNSAGAGCSYEGKQYVAGATFPSDKSCNTCQCTEQGEVICTRSACEPPPAAYCTSAGKQYSVGQTFSNDGCNTCTCQASGEVACTEIACGEAGAPGSDGPSTCSSLVSEMLVALSSAQSCKSAADCGQPIPNSSCGCTRDLVARKDADLTKYQTLKKQVDDRGCEEDGGSTCDCPNADGFACIANVCAWNYVKPEPPACQPYPPAVLCVRGTPTTDGELISVGDPLKVTTRSAGCFSSSCNQVEQASCSIEAGGYFSVEAKFCIADISAPGKACTADCGQANAECSSGEPLTAGDHQVKLASLAVAFQVPSLLPVGGLCANAL